MDEHQNPEEAVKSGPDHLQSAASDLNEAVSAQIENVCQAAGQKADELRGAAENAKFQATSWQAECEAYVRDNPTKAVLVSLGVGLLLGLLIRK